MPEARVHAGETTSTSVSAPAQRSSSTERSSGPPTVSFATTRTRCPPPRSEADACISYTYYDSSAAGPPGAAPAPRGGSSYDNPHPCFKALRRGGRVLVVSARCGTPGFSSDLVLPTASAPTGKLKLPAQPQAVIRKWRRARSASQTRPDEAARPPRVSDLRRSVVFPDADRARRAYDALAWWAS